MCLLKRITQFPMSRVNILELVAIQINIETVSFNSTRESSLKKMTTKNIHSKR